MKRIPLEVNTGEFFIGYFDTLRVGVGIQLALNFQALFSGCAGDEIHNDSVTDQRFATPVSTNE